MSASKPTVGSASSSACAATRRWTTSIWSWRRGFWHELPFGRRTGSGGAIKYYGLIQHAARDWRVTNAALLLFSQAPPGACDWQSARRGCGCFASRGRAAGMAGNGT